LPDPDIERASAVNSCRRLDKRIENNDLAIRRA
jgi:hypothetical protein